jgi:hypothetical protein
MDAYLICMLLFPLLKIRNLEMQIKQLYTQLRVNDCMVKFMRLVRKL